MNIKKRILLFILLIIVPLFSIWILQQKFIILEGQTMGTAYSIKCYVPKWISKQQLSLDVKNELDRLNLIFSTWDKDSEISLFNESYSTSNITISNEFKYLIDESFKLYDDTTGIFDPTVKSLSDSWGFSSKMSFFSVPNDSQLSKVATYIGLKNVVVSGNVIRKQDPNIKIDLSSMVKGYAVDKISILLDKSRSKRFIIEIGGEVRVKTNNIKKPWRIGITKPIYHQLQQELFGFVEIVDGAIATSGDYQNFFEKDGKIYSHIMDSKTGAPVESDVTSVSIYAPNCMLADALATAVIAMGLNRGLSLIESYPNVEGLIITRKKDKTLSIYQSSGFHKTKFKQIASI